MNSDINMMYGNTYLSAYSIAVKHGFVGSEQDWLDSIGSGKIELKYFEETEMLCWKHKGDTQWNDLLSLQELQKNLATAIIGDMRDEAKEYSELARSWAVGGTGLRGDEDTNNAKYWASVSSLGGGSGTGTGAGGVRSATIVVGTSTAGQSTGEVDYLCSGTADDVILNQAMTAAAGITGGTVIVLPGTYYVTSTVTSKVTVFASGATFISGSTLSQGMIQLNGGHLVGARLRKSTGTGTPCITARQSSRITNCQIAAASGDTGIQAVDTLATAAQWNVIIEDCSFTGECQSAIIATDYCIIRGCHITKVRGYGIHLTDIENFVGGNILDLYFSDSQRGTGILVSGRYNNLVDNTVRNTSTSQELVLDTGASQNMVVGNFANITNSSGTSNYIMANLSDAGQGGGSSGTGSVDSVNGKTGVVVLTASDVGAAEAVHTHSADDITGGILPINYGGTGASTAVQARQNLGIGMRGICATTADTAAKAVTIDNFPGTALGTIIAVRFTYGNTAASPTLNVSSSGSLSITHNGSTITSDMIPAGWEAILMCASGGYFSQEWVLLNPYGSSSGSSGGSTTTGITTIAYGGTGADNIKNARINLGTGQFVSCTTAAADTSKYIDLGTIDGKVAAGSGFHLVVNFINGNTETSPMLVVSGTATNGSVWGANYPITYNGAALTADMIPVNHNALLELTDSYEWALLNPYISSSGSSGSGDYVSKSGDTMTGDLTISSGGLVVGTLASGTTLGSYSSALGRNITASGNYSFAQGDASVASGLYSSARGYKASATANYAHAAGVLSTASGAGAYAEGGSCIASGLYSRASGYGTTAVGYAEMAHGFFNVLSADSTATWSTDGNALVMGNGTYYSATNTATRSNSFRTTNDGKVYALSAFNSSGADYGEYCEWADGNPEKEERLGYFITWDGDKVRIATDQDDYILGISTVNSAVIGNSDVSTWNGIYKVDLWGRHETETVVTKAGTVINHDAVEDSEGNIIIEAWDETVEEDRTETRFVVNPDYDSSQPYVNRENRPEWVDVGMLGRLWVRDDGTCEVNGYCMPDKNGCAAKSDTGYRVLKKQDGFVWVMFR